MGYLVTLPELAERVGAGTADFKDKLAEGLRDFACTLWENYPDQITQGDNLASSFTRGYMNRTCADKTLPQPPVSPFFGGQCEDVGYDVVIEFQNCGDTMWTQDQIGTVPGRVTALIVELASITSGCGGGDPRNRKNWNLRANYTMSDGIPRQTTLLLGVTYVEFRAIGCVRSDGMPDTCGDPNANYPTTSPTPVDYTTVINIVSEDGDTLNYTAEYKPTNYNFPLNFDLGGIKVLFDLGGINFNFSLVSLDGLPIPLPDGNGSPIPSPQDDGNRNIRCRRLPPPESGDYFTDTKNDTDPKEEDVGEELAFVRVTLTNVPTNIRTQWGDGAPNIIYAGWFEFQGEGYNFPRNPIHFNQNLYPTPEGATGYAYTLYEGITGFATVYTIKEEIEL